MTNGAAMSREGLTKPRGVVDVRHGSSAVISRHKNHVVIASTLIWVPLAIGGAAAGGAAGLGSGDYRIFKLQRKISDTDEGVEVHFTNADAKIIEEFIYRLSKKPTSNAEA